jgi:homogentisate 1,2-dioxygenase
MPFYQSQGSIPKKRHTIFKNPKGGIFYEELVSREGFSYMYSNLYHLNMPTQIMKLGKFKMTGFMIFFNRSIPIFELFKFT